MSKKKVSLILSLILLAYYYFTSGSSYPSILGTKDVATPTPFVSHPQIKPGQYLVTKVVDGDTIKVSDGAHTTTVRLIGVDTPETVDPRKSVQCFGHEASNFTKSLLDNKTVTLTSDPTQQQYDKYGRMLAYVYLPDGTLINEKIIRSGYGYEYTYDVPYQYQKQFKEAQKLAESEGSGLWSSSTCQGKR